MSMKKGNTVVANTGSTISIEPGTQLNGIYEIDELIAHGGMGEVYRGHNIHNDSPVALKIILSELARDDTVLSLFKRESETLNHLSHDCIVRYHLYTTDPALGRPYLAMEFVDGVSLAEHSGNAPMPVEEVKQLLIRIADGLHAAHEAGVIHRDLSPDNIILPDDDVTRAKIVDFGIAKNTSDGHMTVLGGKFAGKYGYVSPEQLGRFSGKVDGRSDIYSLGLVAASALKGAPIEMGETPVEVVERRASVPDLEFIPQPIRSVLTAMLQPDPADRPDTMADVVKLLNEMDAAPAVEPVSEKEASQQEETFDEVSSATPVDEEQQLEGYTHTANEPDWYDPKPANRIISAIPDDADAYDLAPPQAVLPSDVTPEFDDVRHQKDAPSSIDQVQASSFHPSPAQTSSLPKTNEPTPAPKGGKLIPLMVGGVFVIMAGVGAYIMFGSTGPQEVAQPEVKKAEVSETKPEPEETKQVAVVKPKPVEPVVQVVRPKLDAVAQRIAWIKQYNGGVCFWAQKASVTETDASITVYATTEVPLQTFHDAFQDTFESEPQIGGRLIVRAQCPVLSFMQTEETVAGAPVTMQLNKDIIKSGGTIQGAISGIDNRQSEVLLIDTDGFVYNISGFSTKSSQLTSFSMRPGFPADKPVPQMVLGLVTDKPLPEAQIDEPVSAADILPRIVSAVRQRDIKMRAALQYFKIGGY